MALTLKKVFAYDFKINKFLLGCLPYYLRQFLFALGCNNFVSIFSLVGGIFLAIDGLFIVTMYQKTHPQKNYSLIHSPLFFSPVLFMK